MFVKAINHIKFRPKDSKTRCMYMYLIQVMLTKMTAIMYTVSHANQQLHAVYEVIMKALATVAKSKPNHLATWEFF